MQLSTKASQAQPLGHTVTIEPQQSVAMEIQPVAMVTEALSIPVQASNTVSQGNSDLERIKTEEQTVTMEMQPVTMEMQGSITGQFGSSVQKLEPREDAEVVEGQVENIEEPAGFESGRAVAMATELEVKDEEHIMLSDE